MGIANDIASLDATAQDQIERAEQALYNLATEGAYQNDFKPFSEALKTALTASRTTSGREA